MKKLWSLNILFTRISKMAQFYLVIIFLFSCTVANAQVQLPENHSHAITFAGVFDDHTKLISSSYTGGIIINEIETGKSIYSNRNLGHVKTAFITSDEKYFVGSVNGVQNDSYLIKFDLVNFKIVRKISFDKPDNIWQIAVDQENMIFYTGSLESGIKRWDLSTLEELDQIWKGTVSDMELSESGRFLAWSSWKEGIQVWDSESEKIIAEAQGHYTEALSISEQRGIIAYKTYKNKNQDEVIIASLRNLERIGNFSLPHRILENLEFSKDGRYLFASYLYQDHVDVFDLKSLEAPSLWLELGADDGINFLDVTDEGFLILGAMYSGKIQLFNSTLEIQKGISQESVYPTIIKSLSQDSLLIGSSDGYIRMINLKTGQIVYHYKLLNGRISSLDILKDKIAIAGRTKHNRADSINDYVYEVTEYQVVDNSGNLIFKKNGYIDVKDDETKGIYLLDDHSVGFFISQMGSPFEVWNYNTSQKTGSISVDGLFTESSYLSQNRKLMLSGGFKGLRTWNVENGRAKDVLIKGEIRTKLGGLIALGLNSSKLHEKMFRDVTLSNDLRWAAAATDVIEIWDIKSGKTHMTLERISNVVEFSPSGDQLFIKDDSVRLINIITKDIIWSRDFLADVNEAEFSKDGSFIYVPSSNGSLAILNAKNGERLCDLYFIGPKDYVVTTPDGYFDASSGGLDKLYFIEQQEIIELDQLKDRFYEPNLLQKVLGYSDEPLRNSRGLGKIDLFPDIILTHPLQNNGNLGIELSNRGGGIGKVKIWINGKEVTTDAREAGYDINAQTVTINYKIEGHPYLKQGEVNEIEVKAYNGEEYLSSRGKKVLYIPKGKKEDYDPTLHAIIVGTSNYSGEALDLRFAAKDAVDFSNALQMVGDKYFTSDKVNIHLLSTEPGNTMPTKENIANAFKEVSNTARPYDVLVVYLSGHGVNYGGSEGDFYYLTMDASSGNLKDPAIRESVGISSDELTEYIKLVPALKQVLILDACHSGQVAEDLMESRADRPSSEIRALERMKDRTGTYILAGSAADAVSYETSVYGQGLLTYSLLFGMKGAALRDDKFVDVVQLFQFAADKVPELAANIGGIQKPEIRTPYGGQSFDIGISDEAVRAKIILPSPKPLFVQSRFSNDETFNDDIRLSKKLDDELREFSSARGADQSLIFIDAARFSNAYSLKGRYTKSGDTYTVDVRLFNGDEVVSMFRIEGDSDSLSKLILDKVKESL